MDLRDLVISILGGKILDARQWVQDAIREDFNWSTVSKPVGINSRELILTAALVELFSDRAKIPRPTWTAEVGASFEPIWLIKCSSQQFANRIMRETPEPLRSRQVFAPAEFLTFA